MLLLAIAVSTAGLPPLNPSADTNVSALRCGTTALTEKEENPTARFRGLSRYMQFAALAASEDPGSSPYLDRLTEKAIEAAKLSASPDKPTRAACEAQFRQVYQARIAEAEQDSFSQTALCLITVSLLHGLSTQAPGFSGSDSIAATVKLYSEKLSEADLATRGLSDETKFLKFTGDLLAKKLQTHSFEGIALGCGVSPY